MTAAGMPHVPEDVDHLTGNDLLQVIQQYARADDRSLQIEIGPSEIGNNCERRVAMALLGAPRPNVSRDEWTSAVGSACHKYVEGAFHWHNEQLVKAGKPPRWLVETAVEIRTGLTGHCDLYDTVTNEVIDHKFPGVTAIRKYKKKNHPGQQYQWQAHLYGLGWRKLGFPVKNVSLVMYPRSGLLRDAWKWTEPYDESIAMKALDRVDTLLTGMDIAEGLNSLEDFLDLLSRDTEFCTWCGYYDPQNTNPVEGCRGPFYDPGFVEQPTSHSMTVPGIF